MLQLKQWQHLRQPHLLSGNGVNRSDGDKVEFVFAGHSSVSLDVTVDVRLRMRLRLLVSSSNTVVRLPCLNVLAQFIWVWNRGVRTIPCGGELVRELVKSPTDGSLFGPPASAG